MAAEKYNRIEVVIKLLTLLSVLIAGVWAFHTYTDTKEKEFYTQFWNTKLALYLETSSSASTMATTKSIEHFELARIKFNELFFGRLSLVEGESVKQAMERFSSLVPKGKIYETQLPLTELQQPAYRLTITLKKELGAAWRTPFSEL